ncbi:ATP-binding protein [Prevotella cerevisiae]|uniref:ATP-binding protein n=1 Tax=Segatella cerevisiae TaxID=2053716 RepID=A0ABT1BWE8_9BACT|nr:ATP-binding protein [Segatella cerevisiae]MCO6024573.1 ATP-binding protein [Segatella cerevisiae]
MDTTNNMSGGCNQILPNATKAIQNVFLQNGPSKIPMFTPDTPEDDNQVLNMYYYSYSKPDQPDHEILRQNYLDLYDERLREYRLMFICGEEGVGLTTSLRQFAQQHPENCVSYFYNGLDLTSIDPEIIECSLVKQLTWYVSEGSNRESWTVAPKVKNLYQLVLRKINRTKKPLFFVFDGFDKIPPSKTEGVKRLLEDVLWAKGKYLFSGSPEAVKNIFPDGISWPYTQGDLLRFSEAEVNQYFRGMDPSLADGDLKQLYDITRGNAHRMEIVSSRYIEKNRLTDLLNSSATSDSDLYAEDCQTLFANASQTIIDFFSLLAYAEFPVRREMIPSFIGVNSDEADKLIRKNTDFVRLTNDGIVCFRSEGFHRYLRRKLESHQRDIELKIIGVLSGKEYNMEYSSVIPSIYKSLNQTENLINYLNPDNLREIFLHKQSQASLNEQCDFGYEACEEQLKDHLPTAFRFALNKTFSREIEKNELWDYEVEALLSVGKYDQAMLFADNVYLKEERLKYYLLIAGKKEELKMKSSDFDALKESIDQLVNEIDFENIPEKALELAKLLLGVDYEAAINIVDKVALKHKKEVNTDRLYSIFSLIQQVDDPEENIARRDLVTKKITDENLRKFTRAAQGLLADADVETFLSSLDNLNSNSQKLQLLRYWLPQNENKQGIGKAVLTAIKLMVNTSDRDMPRAKILNEICSSMHCMSEEEMKEALPYIDGMGESIKFPTFDYVDVELTIIEALQAKLPEKAIDRLGNLYFYIDELQDQGIRLTCFAKMLGKYDQLGDRNKIEKEVISTVDLQQMIIDGIKALLSETAYHLMVVEGPLTALVVNYPTMVDEMISCMNTRERQSRAYSFAATQYLLQVEDEHIDPDYFFELLGKADESGIDNVRPLLLLTDILAHSRKLNNEKLRPSLKKNFPYIEKVEYSEVRCQMLMRVYIWAKKSQDDEEFLNRVKTKILQAWKSIDVDWHKLTIGYYLAKSFAPLSKEDANKMIDRCSSIKKDCFLSTSSCEDTFYQSLDLYLHSLCQLVELKLDDDALLNQFSSDIDHLLSNCEKIRLWGIIAMQYSLVGNDRMFQEITEKYIPGDLESLPIDERKFTVFTIAPVLYRQNSERLFTLLDRFDAYFRNKCLARLAAFIVRKQVFDEGYDLKPAAYELSKADYSNLLSILSHSTDDDTYYQIINIICQSLHKTYQKRPLSTDIKRSVLRRARDIVNEKLPTRNGIQHNGYKIVCLAALQHAEKSFSSRDRKGWETQIQTVGNTADQAFLYFDIAPFFANHKDVRDVIDLGIKKTEELHFSFDRIARLDMAIDECRENNLGALGRDVAKKALSSLTLESDFDEQRHLIDTIYQYKPELATELVEGMDQDPARSLYKNKLLRHISSKKRIDSAKKDTKLINTLNPKEQKRFFESLLESLTDGTGQIISIEQAFFITLPFIFTGNISDTNDAVLYLLKIIGEKERQSRNQKGMLLNLHEIIRNNLRLVLSLAAGTKERIASIDGMMCVRHNEPEGYIPIGEYEKAEQYLLEWYRKSGGMELTIIDPYFNPSGLVLIKKLTDENTNLRIRILTHLGKNKKEDYDFEWHHVSGGIQTPVHIDFVSYEDKPEDCPLHDRYWICSDEEKDRRCGITLPSIGTLGRKESSITPIQESLISEILLRQTRYSFEVEKTEGGRCLAFDHLELE